MRGVGESFNIDGVENLLQENRFTDLENSVTDSPDFACTDNSVAKLSNSLTVNLHLKFSSRKD